MKQLYGRAMGLVDLCSGDCDDFGTISLSYELHSIRCVGHRETAVSGTEPEGPRLAMAYNPSLPITKALSSNVLLGEGDMFLLGAISGLRHRFVQVRE
jgi:hypothetical protein